MARVFSLNEVLLKRILFSVLVSLSAEEPDWYSKLALVSKGMQKTIDRLLEDPSVVEQLTFWDCRQATFLCRVQGDLIDSIRIRAKPGPPDHSFFVPFKSVKHLVITGASSQKLLAYFEQFEGQLEHVTTDCIMDNTAEDTVWPRKVTLLQPSGEDAVFQMTLAACDKGMQELEIAHCGSSAAVEVFTFVSFAMAQVIKEVNGKERWWSECAKIKAVRSWLIAGGCQDSQIEQLDQVFASKMDVFKVSCMNLVVRLVW